MEKARMEGAPSRHAACRAAARAGFRSLLVPLDFSTRSERILQRVVLLPNAPEVRIRVLHVIPKLRPTNVRAHAEKDARAALETAAAGLRRQLPRGAVVEPRLIVGTPASEIARSAASARTELIVMGRGGGRTFRDLFLGSTAERVIRQSRRPVLVVRQPARRSYQRPLVALDLDQTALDVLALLPRILPPPRPRVEVVHVYDAPFQGLIYPTLSREEMREHRDYYRSRAAQELVRILDATPPAGARPGSGDRFPWRAHVRYGSPRIVVRETVEETRADLLLLGTHGYAGIAQAFLGSVAGDLLREVPCDVLVVPPRRAAPPRR